MALGHGSGPAGSAPSCLSCGQREATQPLQPPPKLRPSAWSPPCAPPPASLAPLRVFTPLCCAPPPRPPSPCAPLPGYAPATTPPAPHLSGSPTPRPSAGSVPTLGGGRQALCRGCQGNPDSDWLPRHVHRRVHSDSLLSGHQASGLPASSCNLPPGISTWLLQRPPTHTFKTGLPLAPASHLLFTHQARPPLPPPAPPRVSQFHTRGLCRPWRLLPDMSPEDNTAPLPFSPHRSHSEV